MVARCRATRTETRHVRVVFCSRHFATSFWTVGFGRENEMRELVGGMVGGSFWMGGPVQASGEDGA